MVAASPDVILDGLLFPEAPRWRDGRLWLSEKRAGRVLEVDAGGSVRATIAVSGEPGGIGWLADGTMLVVSMATRSVVRITADGTQSVHADISELTTYRCNDMVVDRRGNAYVGDFGYDMAARAAPAPGVLVLVPADGSVPRVVADDLHFPNGAVVTPDGSTLIVAESAANRLTAFGIEVDGSLTGRRVWADLGATVPDGICLDESGAVWVADPLGNQVVRVGEGNVVLERVATEQGAFACELGGDDGRTLFVCTYDAAASASPNPTPVGRLEVVRVDVPAAG
ncbi:MAG: SMP-30/gluconolactonase/LRE family protein [Ilumatobacteraceae bacterium]